MIFRATTTAEYYIYYTVWNLRGVSHEGLGLTDMKSSHCHALDSVWNPMGFRQHESGNSNYIPDNKPAPVLYTRLVLTCLAGTP